MQDLKIKLRLDSASFKSEMNNAKSILSDFANSGSKGFKSLGDGIGSLSGKFGSFGSVATTTFKGVHAAYKLGVSANKEFIGDLKTAISVGTKVGVAVGGAFALIAKEGKIGRASCRERVCQYV